ncbi:MAG: 2Fe-2S iron-sulfur cluster binding domain-containing protein [Holophagales bacterium]|nr:2Fe-2S iron-sulfur cluster binding domain-containing protein [Holophagales bacterium]
MGDRTDDPNDLDSGPGGVSRRGFLGSVLPAAVGVAVASDALSAPAGKAPVAELPAAEPSKLTLVVNGRTHKVLVEPRDTLLSVLREKLGLTGTKPGCERGECGACSVLIDGVPRYSCLTLALEAEGKAVTTVEGLMEGEELGPVQKAFVEEDAFQCGYCTPGQVIAAEGLLRANPDPTLDEIRLGVSGNLCRCGTYAHIFKAVGKAAELRKGR